VYSAVCHPDLRYLPGDGQPPCFLRPEATELRVFAEDGSKAAPFDWLKITGKTKSLLHHPESNYVKISQALDQASPIKIGGLMVLGFFNTSDASWVVEWVRKNLKVDVIQEKDRYG
jgi:sentrin-specific protease 7